MIPRFTASNRREDGFVLATVLVFMLVLTLSVFFGAGLTRTDVQVVNNEQNQKEAFRAAEAGIDEALYRLSLIGGDTAAITGINGGSAFQASLAPTVPGRDTSNGASDFGIKYTDPASTSQILFVTTVPGTWAQNNPMPTLQPPATNRSLYSTNAADGAPVDMTATTNLTVGWERCTAAQAAVGASIGCGGGTGSLRQFPPGAATTRALVRIVSTGQSGTARQRLTVLAADCIPATNNGNGGIVSLGGICSQGVGLNGAGTISAAGLVQINAGANSNNPSTCTAASTGGAGSSITGSQINVVGGVSGNFNPPANTGVLPTADPYAGANLWPPCFTGAPSPCQTIPTPAPQGAKNGAACGGTASSPAVCTASSNGDVLSPGIYYGGIRISAGNSGNPIRLQSGIYIMAGGGFSSTSGNNYVVSNAGGVFIYNTSDPSQPTGAGAAGQFNLANGNTLANLVSPTSGAFAGVVLYQDRTLSPQPDISITGGNALHILDGLVYAPGANFNVQGGTVASTTIGGSLIVNSITMIGASSLIVQNPANPLPIQACQTVAYVPIGWQDF